MRVGFLQSTVDHFLAHNEQRVQRSTRFNRMTDVERNGIVNRLRCLAQAGGRLTEIADRIAQETGRSVETIRHTLRYFDIEPSNLAIFPRSCHPLQIATKTEIYRQFRRGESVAALAKRFDQTKPRIYHIINDLNAARIMELPLDYIGNEQFARLCSRRRIARDIENIAGRRSAGKKAAACPAVCQRMWPASTTCRC